MFINGINIQRKFYPIKGNYLRIILIKHKRDIIIYVAKTPHFNDTK